MEICINMYTYIFSSLPLSLLLLSLPSPPFPLSRPACLLSFLFPLFLSFLPLLLLSSSFFSLSQSSPKDTFISLTEGGREEERETNIYVREKHWSVASCVSPNQRLNLQPRYVPVLGIEPESLWCTRWSQLSHPARAATCLLYEYHGCLFNAITYMYLPHFFKWFFFFKDFIYSFLERGEEREKERERNITVSSAPYWGPGLQPRHAPWPGIELATLWFAALRSIHWATPARAQMVS